MSALACLRLALATAVLLLAVQAFLAARRTQREGTPIYEERATRRAGRGALERAGELTDQPEKLATGGEGADKLRAGDSRGGHEPPQRVEGPRLFAR